MSAPNADRSQLDVAVVGGSIAGFATAIRFSQMGHRVAVFDKKAMNDRVLQAAVHPLHPAERGAAAGRARGGPPPRVRLFGDHQGGLRHARRPDGGARWLPSRQPDSYALNLERRVLDPALRAAARRAGRPVLRRHQRGEHRGRRFRLDAWKPAAEAETAPLPGPAGGGRGRAPARRWPRNSATRPNRIRTNAPASSATSPGSTPRRTTARSSSCTSGTWPASTRSSKAGPSSSCSRRSRGSRTGTASGAGSGSS